MPGTTYERPRVLRLRFRGARRLHTVSHADERLPRSRRATASRASTGRRRGRACDLGRHVRGVLRRCFSSRAAVELPREPLAWTRGFSEVPRGFGSPRGLKDSRFKALEARIQDLEGWIPPFFGRFDPFLVGERRRAAPERRKIWLLSARIRDFPSKPRIQRPVFNPRGEPSDSRGASAS